MARGLPDRWGDQQVEVRRSTRRRRTVTAYRQGEVVVVLVPARLRIAEIEQAVADLVPKVLAKESRRRSPAGDVELQRLFPPGLIVRDSTGPPPDASAVAG